MLRFCAPQSFAFSLLSGTINALPSNKEVLRIDLLVFVFLEGVGGGGDSGFQFVCWKNWDAVKDTRVLHDWWNLSYNIKSCSVSHVKDAFSSCKDGHYSLVMATPFVERCLIRIWHEVKTRTFVVLRNSNQEFVMFQEELFLNDSYSFQDNMNCFVFFFHCVQISWRVIYESYFTWVFCLLCSSEIVFLKRFLEAISLLHLQDESMSSWRSYGIC